MHKAIHYGIKKKNYGIIFNGKRLETAHVSIN